MPASIIGSRYDISLCRKVPFLKHMKMTGEVLVPDTSPIYSKQDSRKILDIPLDDFVIFTGANNILEKRKGFKVLVEAVNRLVDLALGGRRITFLIVGNLKGDFPYKVDPRVNFIVKGFLPKEVFFRTYYACDVYASPTLADSGPMMVNYAVASGRPVVAFPVGCAMDLVVNEKTGYMARYGDYEDFARGLLLFYKMSDKEINSYEKMCRAHIMQFKV